MSDMQDICYVTPPQRSHDPQVENRLFKGNQDCDVVQSSKDSLKIPGPSPLNTNGRFCNTVIPINAA